MRKHPSFEIFETSSKLRCMIRKESNLKNILRQQSLLYIKEKTFKKQSDLASHLDYPIRSMELWLEVYKEEGIEVILIRVKTKKRKISREVQ